MPQGKRGRRARETARQIMLANMRAKGKSTCEDGTREDSGGGLCVMGERGEDETLERGGRFGGFVLIRDKDGGDTLRFAGLGEVTLQSLLVGTC